MKYYYELKSGMKCSLDRAFPIVIKDELGRIVQYAKTISSAEQWIQQQQENNEIHNV